MNYKTDIHLLFNRSLILSVVAFSVGLSHYARAASLVLSPQMVVDQVLSKGLSAKSAELESKRTVFGLERALGVYDFQLSFNGNYERNEAQTLTGTGNLVDRTLTFGALLSKRIQTGTTISLGVDGISQNSTLSSFTQATRTPNANLQDISILLRQSLLANAFGQSDRISVEIAQSQVEISKDTRVETLESLILSGLTSFWNGYIAEQQLKANLAARDKYEQLVKNVRRKAGFNLSSPGELPRLEAEFNSADSRVKTSSADYLSALDSLLVTIKIDRPTDGDIIFDVPKNLPPVPRLAAKRIEDIRAAKIARENLQNAERGLTLVKSQTMPKLDLVARAKTTGVDQDSSRALAEMSSGRYPTYAIGVELSTPIDSSLNRGLVSEAAIQIELARNNLELVTDNVSNLLRIRERNVEAYFSVANSASTAVDLRERVVREMEVSYRQGRQPLVELIRAYNDLFLAQLSKAQGIGQYNIALNELAAARDELIAGANPEVKRSEGNK